MSETNILVGVFDWNLLQSAFEQTCFIDRECVTTKERFNYFVRKTATDKRAYFGLQ